MVLIEIIRFVGSCKTDWLKLLYTGINWEMINYGDTLRDPLNSVLVPTSTLEITHIIIQK